jgi:hypothetical protein
MFGGSEQNIEERSNDYRDSGSASRFFTQTEWECSTDCPTQMFPTTKAATSRTERGNRSPFVSGTSDLQNDTVYQDGGGSASRFFTTTGWECSADCPTVQFPETKSGGGNKATKNADTFLGTGFGGTDNSVWKADSGSASRFFTQTEPDFPPLIYQAKASKADRNAGLEGLEGHSNSKMFRTANNTSDTVSAGFERFDTKPAQNFHPTVKPTSLMRHLIRLVTPPNGVVLDPFLGSGTTAVAAILENCEWVGSEITPNYWPIIESRVEWATNQRAETTQNRLF